MRRVFIAINLPSKVKKKLSFFQEELLDLPVKWVEKDNFHITLAFIGNLSDQETGAVCQDLEKIKGEISPFSVSFNEISYDSMSKKVPRLIWAKGEKSEDFSFLKEKVDLILKESIGFIPDKREFLPHITLARVKKWQWKKIDPEERPEVRRDVSFSFGVDSIEIMESKLKPSGAEYIELGSILLEKDE